MKLRNKKTGETGELHFEPDKEYHFTVVTEDPADIRIYKELSLLSKEWEDYEEPKECYYIDPSLMRGYSRVVTGQFPRLTKLAKELGIGFETTEEAEKAVEKLKAWKRLKDSGFEFGLIGGRDIEFTYPDDCCNDKSFWADIDLLFGGEKMREFKFRLWDEIAKRWVSRGELVEMASSQNFPENISMKSKFYLEQYTGLKDKNGKEIYEGDILLIPARKDKVKGNLYTVIWHKVHARFNFGNKNGEFGEIQIGKIKRAEVIGNIHENPELLEGEK